MAFGPVVLPEWARWSAFTFCVGLVSLSSIMLLWHLWLGRVQPDALDHFFPWLPDAAKKKFRKDRKLAERKAKRLDFSIAGVIERSRQDNLHIRTQEALERARLEAVRVADFQAWDRVPVLSIREAAHLWAGERPTSDTGQLSQMAAVMRRELIEAGNAGKLLVVALAEPMSDMDLALHRMEHDQLVAGGASSYYGTVFQDSRVTRENLRAYASSKSERPPFLFPEDR